MCFQLFFTWEFLYFQTDMRIEKIVLYCIILYCIILLVKLLVSYKEAYLEPSMMEHRWIL